ncbi:hypothetical protein TWF481_004006 [Arthrobotrys musiformis]|uniref:Uncharacterized protein n=1 Tax=Arthrobotrys musiformis TaxID=47236 RepID=A0AAV9WIA0_9PEZI
MCNLVLLSIGRMSLGSKVEWRYGGIEMEEAVERDRLRKYGSLKDDPRAAGSDLVSGRDVSRRSGDTGGVTKSPFPNGLSRGLALASLTLRIERLVSFCSLSGTLSRSGSCKASPADDLGDRENGYRNGGPLQQSL